MMSVFASGLFCGQRIVPLGLEYCGYLLREKREKVIVIIGKKLFVQYEF